MNQYTIFCTPAQTHKALSLGAPIEVFGFEDTSRQMVEIAKQEGHLEELESELNKTDHATIIGDLAYVLPTSEQICGWLEDVHHIRFNVSRYGGNDDATIFFKEDRRRTFYRIKRSYKEALLACIDEALDYLIQTKV